jgi:hypothetical protein
MKTWMTGNTGRTIYSVTSPPAPRYYLNELKTVRVPTLLVRQTGEAWLRPFIAVYEPYGNGTSSSVKLVRRMKGAPLAGDFAGIVVERAGGIDYILNAIDSTAAINYESISFKGIYGVISADTNGFTRLYLGTGTYLTWGDHAIKSASLAVKASLISSSPAGRFTGWSYSSDKEVTISFSVINSLNIPLKEWIVYCKAPGGIFSVKPTRVIAGKKSSGKTLIVTAVVPAAVEAKLYIGRKNDKDIL